MTREFYRRADRLLKAAWRSIARMSDAERAGLYAKQLRRAIKKDRAGKKVLATFNQREVLRILAPLAKISRMALRDGLRDE